MKLLSFCIRHFNLIININNDREILSLKCRTNITFFLTLCSRSKKIAVTSRAFHIIYRRDATRRISAKNNFPIHSTSMRYIHRMPIGFLVTYSLILSLFVVVIHFPADLLS